MLSPSPGFGDTQSSTCFVPVQTAGTSHLSALKGLPGLSHALSHAHRKGRGVTMPTVSPPHTTETVDLTLRTLPAHRRPAPLSAAPREPTLLLQNTDLWNKLSGADFVTLK